MKRDDFFCAEPVGIDLVRLTLFGADTNRRGGRGSAEVILDRDDAEELIHDLERALRAKVKVTVSR